MTRIGALLLALLCVGTVQAEPVVVHGARLWAAPDHTRVVFDVSGPVQHSLFALSDPHRIVIDLDQARLQETTMFDGAEGVVRGIRSAAREETGLRVVLDVEQRVTPKSFLLRPNSKYGHRLVIDLHNANGNRRVVKSAGKPKQKGLRDIVIAIDAGHGGEDPGALGRAGTREKDVVLEVARRLERLVSATPGMRAVMIRDGDYYIGLRQRAAAAREARADMFVSIHADAFHDRRAHGASVYALSHRGASSEAARWLADRENAADLVGGVSLEDKDDMLASVLLDLSLTGTIEASLDLGDHVLHGLQRIGPVHKRKVHQAGFVVLKSPDIPSILVETAFISNAGEERKLRSAAHQQKLARAIMGGIRDYFSRNAPPGTRLAASKPGKRTHVIARGDTLSGIAKRYDVSLTSLRAINQLERDLLRVGQELTIPGDG